MLTRNPDNESVQIHQIHEKSPDFKYVDGITVKVKRLMC